MTIIHIIYWIKKYKKDNKLYLKYAIPTAIFCLFLDILAGFAGYGIFYYFK